MADSNYQTRERALQGAEALARTHGDVPMSAEDLVASAKTIEEYLRDASGG